MSVSDGEIPIDMREQNDFLYIIKPVSKVSLSKPSLPFESDPGNFAQKLANDGVTIKSFKITIGQDNVTSIAEANAVPESYHLDQNYPNPFNPATTITYGIPKAVKVSLGIYNILGQEIRSLVDSDQQAGVHKVMWNGRDNQGVNAASGLYLYKTRYADGTNRTNNNNDLLNG